MDPRHTPSPAGKWFLSLGLIGASAVYAVTQQWQGTGTAATTPSSVPPTTAVISTPPVQTPAPGTPAGMGMQNRVMGGGMMRVYKDGSYTGTAADAYYGLVQVKAVITNGSITDVQFLQYPNDRGTSIEINSQAMPLLTQEAIQVQSANVSGVSGATETTLAFRQSLASALILAKN